MDPLKTHVFKHHLSTTKKIKISHAHHAGTTLVSSLPTPSNANPIEILMSIIIKIISQFPHSHSHPYCVRLFSGCVHSWREYNHIGIDRLPIFWRVTLLCRLWGLQREKNRSYESTWGPWVVPYPWNLKHQVPRFFG